MIRSPMRAEPTQERRRRAPSPRRPARPRVRPRATRDGCGDRSDDRARQHSDGGLSLFNTLMGDSGVMPSGATTVREGRRRPRAVHRGRGRIERGAREAGCVQACSGACRARPRGLEVAVKAGDTGSSEDIGRIPRASSSERPRWPCSALPLATSASPWRRRADTGSSSVSNSVRPTIMSTIDITRNHTLPSKTPGKGGRACEGDGRQVQHRVGVGGRHDPLSTRRSGPQRARRARSWSPTRRCASRSTCRSCCAC